MCQFRLWTIHISPPSQARRVFFVWNPPLPCWKFQLSSILSLKKICFWDLPPPGISDDFFWGGYGCFLDHTLQLRLQCVPPPPAHWPGLLSDLFMPFCCTCTLKIWFHCQVVNRRGHTQAADWWSYGVLMVSEMLVKYNHIFHFQPVTRLLQIKIF